MEKKDRVDVQELVSACARLALYVVDELEPTSSDVLEADLDALYELAVLCEKKGRAEGRIKE